MIFNNINSRKISVKFHEIYLYNENNNYKYLFFIPSSSIVKKYLIDLDYQEFYKFVEECLQLGYPRKCSKFEFESQIIQLIENYKIYNDFETQILINKI